MKKHDFIRYDFIMKAGEYREGTEVFVEEVPLPVDSVVRVSAIDRQSLNWEAIYDISFQTGFRYGTTIHIIAEFSFDEVHLLGCVTSGLCPQQTRQFKFHHVFKYQDNFDENEFDESERKIGFLVIRRKVKSIWRSASVLEEEAREEL